MGSLSSEHPPANGSAAATDEVVRIAAIAGLDFAQGLRLLNGHRAAYLHVLRQFTREHGRDSERLVAGLADGDAVTVGRIVHTLKGVAGTIGAHGLQAAAASLEADLRTAGDQGALRQALATFGALLDGLVAAIAAALPPQPAPIAAQAFVRDDVRAALHELDTFLAEGDTQANACVAMHAPSLRAAFGAEGDALVEEIESFRYGAARDRIANLRLQRGLSL